MQNGGNVRTLRWLIALTGVAIAVILLIEIAFPALGRSRLSPELAALLAGYEDQELDTTSAVLVGSILLWLVAMAASLIGLWWCRRWARRLFTLCIALSLPIVIAAPAALPSVQIQTPVDQMATVLLSLLNGATLALVWQGMQADFARAPAKSDAAQPSAQ